MKIIQAFPAEFQCLLAWLTFWSTFWHTFWKKKIVPGRIFMLMSNLPNAICHPTYMIAWKLYHDWLCDSTENAVIIFVQSVMIYVMNFVPNCWIVWCRWLSFNLPRSQRSCLHGRRSANSCTTRTRARSWGGREWAGVSSCYGRQFGWWCKLKVHLYYRLSCTLQSINTKFAFTKMSLTQNCAN